MKYEIKELGLGGILDHGVSLLKDNFGLLFGILMVMMIPLNLATGFAVHYLMPDMIGAPMMTPGASEAEVMASAQQLQEAAARVAIVSVIAALLTFLIVLPVTNAAALHALSQKYLGKPASLGSSIGFAFSKLPALLWTNILQGILILLGLIALIIPGIILIFRYLLSDQVVVVEGLSGSAALKRSGALMKGNAGTAFVLSFILGIIGALIGAGAEFIPVPEVKIVTAAVVQGLIFSLGIAAWVALYFSARCKHESFDLTVLADQLGEESAQAEA